MNPNFEAVMELRNSISEKLSITHVLSEFYPIPMIPKCNRSIRANINALDPRELNLGCRVSMDSSNPDSLRNRGCRCAIPSFHIEEGKGRACCSTCHAVGDVVRLYSEAKGITEKEAIFELARMLKIAVTAGTYKAITDQYNTERLLNAVYVYCQQYLYELSETGILLKKGGFSRGLQRHLGLAAYPGSQAVYDMLSRLGYKEPQIKSANVCYPDEAYIGCLVFPYHIDAQRIAKLRLCSLATIPDDIFIGPDEHIPGIFGLQYVEMGGDRFACTLLRSEFDVIYQHAQDVIRQSNGRDISYQSKYYAPGGNDVSHLVSSYTVVNMTISYKYAPNDIDWVYRVAGGASNGAVNVTVEWPRTIRDIDEPLYNSLFGYVKLDSEYANHLELPQWLAKIYIPHILKSINPLPSEKQGKLEQLVKDVADTHQYDRRALTRLVEQADSIVSYRERRDEDFD